MWESLFQAYLPLLTWTGLGLIGSRWAPKKLPKFLGQGLYWFGVPLQLFVLARHTTLAESGWVVEVAIAVLLASAVLAWGGWQVWQWASSRVAIADAHSAEVVVKTSVPVSNASASLGSFILAAILGNTGFVGLTLTDVLTDPMYRNWAVIFSVVSNVVGTYGLAVVVASYFGQPTDAKARSPWKPLRDLVTVPSLWAFAIGLYTQTVPFPAILEANLEPAVWVVVACALVLVGIRLGTISNWQAWQLPTGAALLKVGIVPVLVGVLSSVGGLSGDPQRLLVLMSGTPTGLSVLILAEVYNLDRDLLALSIAFSFVGLLLMLPFWLVWFG